MLPPHDTSNKDRGSIQHEQIDGTPVNLEPKKTEQIHTSMKDFFELMELVHMIHCKTSSYQTNGEFEYGKSNIGFIIVRHFQ